MTPIELVQRELNQLRDELKEAYARIEELSKAALNPDHYDQALVLAHTLKLTHKEAVLLLALYDGRTRVLRKDSLMDILYGSSGGREPEIKIIDVFVCKIRKKVGFDAIDCIWGAGYKLTAVGQALVYSTLHRRQQGALAQQGLPA